jgi:hypothetical protein
MTFDRMSGENKERCWKVTASCDHEKRPPEVPGRLMITMTKRLRRDTLRYVSEDAKSQFSALLP